MASSRYPDSYNKRSKYLGQKCRPGVGRWSGNNLNSSPQTQLHTKSNGFLAVNIYYYLKANLQIT